MHKVAIAGSGALAISCFALAAHADCVARGFLESDFPHNPVYEAVSCGPAERVVELLRKSNPRWLGAFSYLEGDVVITVKPANDDARKLMGRDIEYWYYPSGCAGVRDGMRFAQPEIRELCCDAGPISTLPCGIGGKQLVRL